MRTIALIAAALGLQACCSPTTVTGTTSGGTGISCGAAGDGCTSGSGCCSGLSCVQGACHASASGGGSPSAGASSSSAGSASGGHGSSSAAASSSGGCALLGCGNAASSSNSSSGGASSTGACGLFGCGTASGSSTAGVASSTGGVGSSTGGSGTSTGGTGDRCGLSGNPFNTVPGGTCTAEGAECSFAGCCAGLVCPPFNYICANCACDPFCNAGEMCQNATCVCNPANCNSANGSYCDKTNHCQPILTAGQACDATLPGECGGAGSACEVVNGASVCCYQTPAFCQQNSDCCAGFCLNRSCQVPPLPGNGDGGLLEGVPCLGNGDSQCGEPGDAPCCATGAICGTGCTCGLETPCNTPADCCQGTCQNGNCTNVTSCANAGATCAQNSDCCGNQCTGGSCACSQHLYGCTQTSDCCAKTDICDQDPDEFQRDVCCIDVGDPCENPYDCCSESCGATTPGLCDPPP